MGLTSSLVLSHRMAGRQGGRSPEYAVEETIRETNVCYGADQD
jgi:hypothetical protein